jgi:serine O-acetyltransferase
MVKLVPIARLFWLLNRVLFSIDIDPRATLKEGLVILHGAGNVIGKAVVALGDF